VCRVAATKCSCGKFYPPAFALDFTPLMIQTLITSTMKNKSPKKDQLDFATAVSILSNLLVRKCGRTHAIEDSSARCERVFYLCPKATPDITAPAEAVNEIKDLPAWSGTRITVGVLFRGLTGNPEDLSKWMAANTTLDWFAWMMDADNGGLYIRPRSKHGSKFNRDMLGQLERLASKLERSSDVTAEIVVKIEVPLTH
jgi:hypothetical protein